MYSRAAVEDNNGGKRAKLPAANFPPKDSGWRPLSSPAHRLQHTMLYQTTPYHTVACLTLLCHTLPYHANSCQLRHYHDPQLSTTLKSPGATALSFEFATRQLIQTLIPVSLRTLCSPQLNTFLQTRQEYTLQVEPSGLYPSLIRYEIAAEQLPNKTPIYGHSAEH